MVWNAVFPTANTQINQSVTQIQDNWAFLETTIGADHYFNTGATNGYHQQVHMNNLGADPALNGMDAVFYTKETGAALFPVLYQRDSTGVSQIPTYSPQSTVFVGPGTQTIFSITSIGDFNGIVCISDNANPGNRGMAFFAYDGVAIAVTQLAVSGLITSITASANHVQVTVSGAVTLKSSPLFFFT